LAEALTDSGFDLLTGGTDTHLLQLDLRSSVWTGQAAELRLAEIGITVNRNTVPFDERPPSIASGVRPGTPAVTIRGFTEDDTREVGAIIVEALAAGALDTEALRWRVERPLRAPAALPRLLRMHTLRHRRGELKRARQRFPA